MRKHDLLRPFYLARILFERTDEDHYLTTADLMRILEEEYGIKTHRQTIPADVGVLREIGMDIQEVMSSQKRYNVIGRNYDLAEIKLLIDAVQSSKFITKKKSEQLVGKLSQMAGQYQAEALKRNISVEDRIKYENESILLIIDSVNQAINEGKKIAFLYFKYNIQKEPQLRNEGNPFV
ncbi:MAG: WYL domain-containing protein, partial [Firmicutes bacterium]|nr:WYL domain-containing protein [Bacillota bacterium]